VCSLFAFFPLCILLNDAVNLLQSLYYNDSVSPVGVLSWLYKPSVSSFCLEPVLDGIVAICLLTFLLFFYLLVSFVIFLQEVIELFVALLLYMKCHGNINEWVLF